MSIIESEKMKNQKESRTVSLIRKVFNVRAWCDYDRMKIITGYVLNAFKQLFIPDKKNPKNARKNFKNAVSEMRLSKTELNSQQKSLYRLALLMCFLALLLGSYGFYHLFAGAYRAFFVSIVLTALALVLAFRYHYWYFQIKEQKLGCSFKEWYQKGLLGRKS